MPRRLATKVVVDHLDLVEGSSPRDGTRNLPTRAVG
jgi:hypothetical protein